MRFFAVFCVGFGACFVVKRKRNVLVVREYCVKALEQNEKSSSACIYDACLFENGQHLGSLFKHFFTGFDNLGKEVAEIDVSFIHRSCGFAHGAHNRKYGSFFGFGYRFICNFGSLCESVCKILCGKFFFCGQNVRNSFYYLTGNNSAVSASAFKSPLGKSRAQRRHGIG